MDGVSTWLVVSLSGLENRTLDRCAEFAAELRCRGVPLTLLVAPRPERAEPPSPDSPVQRWVRDRVDDGDTIALHGFEHSAPTDGLLPRLVTGRGAEFAALPAHEAGLRLIAALATVERLGLRVETFVPPRWLASPGTLSALRHHGFTVCADGTAVHELGTGLVHRARVHAFGSGERGEVRRCRSLVSRVGRTARRGLPVRLAVDAADLQRPLPGRAVLDAVDLALEQGAVPRSYDDFASRVPRPRGAESAGNVAVNLDPLSR